MKHRLVALTAVLAVAFTGGCGVLGNAAAGASDIASNSTPGSRNSKATPEGKTAEPTPEGKTAEPTPSAKKKHSTDIPDPCTLLDETEVVDLTHREITQIDEDGGAAGDPTRFCQWQQSGGQLAVFLSHTTPEDFQITIDEAVWVDGVGDDAYAHSGHLYVRSGTVQIDVYSRGASDAKNLADAKAVAETLIPRI
ncbi:hypothetical protein [Actinoplanes sp. NPDC026670]|uniref:hypothetical protein n=1 Tax=Actinoplanes sp. NPDC026670 TaxID=3154700 RepID=UPI00341100AF